MQIDQDFTPFANLVRHAGALGLSKSEAGRLMIQTSLAVAIQCGDSGRFDVFLHSIGARRSAARPRYVLFRISDDRFVVFEEWVPRFDPTAIERDLERSGVTRQKAMEHHAKVSIDALEIGEKRLIAWPIACSAKVDLAPCDKGA